MTFHGRGIILGILTIVFIETVSHTKKKGSQGLNPNVFHTTKGCFEASGRGEHLRVLTQELQMSLADTGYLEISTHAKGDKLPAWLGLPARSAALQLGICYCLGVRVLWIKGCAGRHKV